MFTSFNKDNCNYPECEKKTINAHAISKSISLQSIAEKQHLKYFSPKQKSKTEKEPFFDEIGINKATTSKIFCKEHDDIFNKLDTKGIFTLEDIILQIYRSVSILLNNEKNALLNKYNYKEWTNLKSITKEQCKTYLNKKRKTPLLDYLDNNEILISIKKKIIFELSENIDDKIREIDNILDYLKYKLLPQSTKEKIQSDSFNTLTTENMQYTLFYYLANFQIPVAINSLNKLIIKRNTLNYYITVVPFENTTVIIGLIPNELLNFEGIVNKINNFFTNKLTILNFIEAIMASHDDWYIKPSIIENMTKAKQNIFKEDCMFINERRFYDEYDISIFDELRKKISNELNDNNELKKILYIPKRDDYQVRYARMIKTILHSIEL